MPRSVRHIPVILAAALPQALLSTWRAAEIALAELGIAAFFAVGVAQDRLGQHLLGQSPLGQNLLGLDRLRLDRLGLDRLGLGPPGQDLLGQPDLAAAAAWAVLAAVLLGLAMRAVDTESYALFVPGGLAGRVREAFGPSLARLAIAARLFERLTIASLGCLVAGHYVSAAVAPALRSQPLGAPITPEGVSTSIALALLAYVWLRERAGALPSPARVSRRVRAALAILAAITLWAAATWIARGAPWPAATPPAASATGISGAAASGSTASGATASDVAAPGETPGAPAASGTTALDAATSTSESSSDAAASGRAAPEGIASTLSIVTLNALGLLIALASTTFAFGSGDALSRVAPELPQPRLRFLQRTIVAVGVYALAITAGTSFLWAALVAPDDRARWLATPLSGLARAIAGPGWARHAALVLLALAALLMLTQTARVALADARRLLVRGAQQGLLDERLGTLDQSGGHPSQRTHTARWGPRLPTSLVNAISVAMAVAILVSSGHVAWLARAYGIAALIVLLLKTWALIRLRALKPMPLVFRVPINVRIGAREWPLGLIALGLLLAAVSLAALLIAIPGGPLLGAALQGAPRTAWAGWATASRGDGATLAGLATVTALFLFFTLGRRQAAEVATAPDDETFQLLSATDVAVAQVDVRPGNVLVAVRHPHLLAHLAAALQVRDDREIVVMTARLRGVDADDDEAHAQTPTAAEGRLFSQVVALAERYGRIVRLLIVPADDVFDALAMAIVRVRAGSVYVGESSTLSADDQARLLGEAWERASKPDALDVRLVVHHHSGGRTTYHLGAHAPALAARDLDLIHQLWLDAVKHVGPHVHHHDIVRAALTQMADKLSGPDREAALDAIQQSARPGDELAAVVRTRDFSQLRDRVRNRPPGDLAALLTDLTLEDQVVVFRVLPRRTAAATFEYLSHEAQEALLKAMAQEDVAALLNNMAPDDRTMFLEELPAPVTRQLLALLTPEERSVAVSLLGYPDGSIGRLMTPHYVAVREDWTVQAVLDYVRLHGQDSETLNVIYVVDEQGLLIDDVRIREFLLTSTTNRVADLMDRRFVALKATDDQETAVALFRQYDRVALPVTDTAGMLIGIVTIDDVLDVAEAAATKEIQRIGGSEALDEPYMKIAFMSMLRKRAGWLTALFLGETLTATAMGAFESEIAKAVVLAMFIPLIISSGGNSGSQASTLVIRALALGEVGLTDWWRVMRRELAAGLALGSILGGVGFMRISLWSAFSGVYGEHWLLVAITVGIALVGIVLWGTLIGSLLPFLLRRLGFDPATSSAPLVATLVDVTGLVIYFTVALIILRGTLL